MPPKSDYLFPGEIVDFIRVERTHEGEKTCTFVIVEGRTDKQAYQSFIAEDKCQIIAAGGKDNVLITMNLLKKEGTAGVLGITDRDFPQLTGIISSSSDILLTDLHDLEMMFVTSPALEKVLREFASVDKLDDFLDKQKKDVRSALIENALPLGYLRWLSLRENWNLNFEELDYEKFIDKNTLKLDPMKMIRYIRSFTVSKGGPKLNISDEEIFQKIQPLKSEDHDPWQICCGHDVVAILALGLRKALGTSKYADPDLIAKALRLSYDYRFFLKTLLYAALFAWEQANYPYLILSGE